MSIKFEFEYSLPNDITLLATALITPGCPPRLNCLPEDAYPGEEDEAEIEKCFIEESNGELMEFFPDGIYTRRHNLNGILVYESVLGKMQAAAIEKWRAAS